MKWDLWLALFSWSNVSRDRAVSFVYHRLLHQELSHSLYAPRLLIDSHLADRNKGDHVFKGGRHIANTKLNRIEECVRADIPPDFLAIINASRPDQALHIVIEITPRRKRIGDTAARETLPDHGTI